MHPRFAARPGSARRWLPAALTFAALALFPGAFPAVRDLALSLDGAHWRNLGRVLSPGAGEEVLPARVRDMQALLGAHAAASFTCSPSLCDSENMQQRVAEGLYPVEQENAAPLRLAARGERVPAACAPLEEKNGIILYRCN